VTIPPDDLPRTPSGRIPQWMLDEAAGRRVEPVPWRSPPQPLYGDDRRARRRDRDPSRQRSPVVGVVVLVLLVAGVWGVGRWRSQQASDPGVPPAQGAEPGWLQPTQPARGSGPLPGFEEVGQPLGYPPHVDWDGSPYDFLRMQTAPGGDQVPVAWSPCRPIHVVVNETGAPDGFVAFVREVMGEISVATGLQFAWDGATDEPPTEDRDEYLPERYGDRWAPVIVGFANEAQIPPLSGTIVGIAAPVGVSRDDLDYSVYVSASVWLDSTMLDEPATAGGPAWLPVLRHEFGHAVGLEHVDDPTQLMNAQIAPGVETFQAGDLFGLTKLGQGACAPDL
jgi:hypothetical protein